MRFITPVFLLFLLFSCSSDLDFSQTENIEITQNFTTSVVYFQVDQTRFLNQTGTQELPEITDISVLDIFSQGYIQDNIVKAIFEFETLNTFDRNFEAIVNFLDSSNQVTQSRNITINPNSQSAVQFSFENTELNSLKTSNQISITVRLQPSAELLDIDQLMQLELKSSAIFTLLVD